MLCYIYSSLLPTFALLSLDGHNLRYCSDYVITGKLPVLDVRVGIIICDHSPGLLTKNPELCLHRCAGDQRLLEIPSSCCRVSGNNPAITYFDD
ncbi:hypothetical protein AG1IA_08128 [Rhizoctonia solani AG-1 IA]|uniref:Uncharacterized protein n=1 Tax=Thanatephorus cucumeris (strain AG1-IA) TaxID=983506 RepID=L8WM66_THACA|nr:hypothetical protein AG1IA_08128 [Rhizoctonia solani AG-1 IA]